MTAAAVESWYTLVTACDSDEYSRSVPSAPPEQNTGSVGDAASAASEPPKCPLNSQPVSGCCVSQSE